MNEKGRKGKYFASDILKEINLSGDIEDINRHENMLACIYAAPVMFLSAVLNIILRSFVWQESMMKLAIETSILCICGILLEVLLRLNLKIKVATFYISCVFSVYFIFLYVSYQNHLGPLLWIVACFQLILVITNVTKDMAIYNGIVIFILCLYTFIKVPMFTAHFNKIYYGIQLLLISCTILAVIGSNHVHTLRYKLMKVQFDIVVKQKQEISDLYRKVADAKEELRQQNEVLQNYNMKIRQNEEELKYLAYHDLLTELPNRKLVYESLEKMIKETKDPEIPVYVVFIDIDYFKNINDKLGHHVGDIFINEAAKRLRNSTVQEDILGRTGGDEFTLIINRNLTKDEVFCYLKTVRDKFAENFVIHNTIIQSTASFGVSIYPRDGEDVISLMKKADVAMYKAKEQGKNKILFYEQDIPCDII